ncbi:tRNA 2-thiouridine(34) synthase MnmA [Flavobacteriales bacterium]|jgi:tRNA-specific 2-thiouridylase|nr:tRNA 2-thiouridine(34) synthase MnmA [Flavobacteriales bacterium]
MKTVVVGLSGGVDSSVAAYLLQKEGFNVIGLFMRNWNDESVIIDDECPWIEDSNDALQVAEKLGIPFQVIDFSKEYKEKIVDYMFKEYKNGRTPNPDILCNREIKFDLFLKKALELGADYVATGHYCRKDEIQINGEKIYRLLAGVDKTKDQSYFLCQVNQYQLSKSLFPIGSLEKKEVRRIANEIGLNTATKKDSQGLCFIGKVKLPIFLQQFLKNKVGEVVEIDRNHSIFNENQQSFLPINYQKNMGTVVGEHNGAHYFTIGQRKGLNIGGKINPLFVIGTDVIENIIYVGQREDHPGLYRKQLSVSAENIHWIREDLKSKKSQDIEYDARIRYRQQLTKCELKFTKSELKVFFKYKQRGITSGQFLSWYKNDELIGSGIIN